MADEFLLTEQTVGIIKVDDVSSEEALNQQLSSRVVLTQEDEGIEATKAFRPE